MKVEKEVLLEKLDKALDRATVISIQRGLPISLSRKVSLVGNLCVEKNEEGLYNVITLDKSILFENLSGFDVAVILAQRYNSGEGNAIREVLSLEKKFSKYHNDMIHYLHCMKKAKKKNDVERLSILEDKFQTAELLARNIKDKLTLFKRTKYSAE